MEKAVSIDLTPKTAATMTKESKAALQQVQKTVSGQGAQVGVNAVSGAVGGVLGGQTKEVLKGSSGECSYGGQCLK